MPSEKVFSSSFSTSSKTFNEFDVVNIILFQDKVFGWNINGATLAMYTLFFS